MKKQLLMASLLAFALATPAIAASTDYNGDAGSSVTNDNADSANVNSNSTGTTSGTNTTTRHHKKMTRRPSSATMPGNYSNDMNDNGSSTGTGVGTGTGNGDVNGSQTNQ